MDLPTEVNWNTIKLAIMIPWGLDMIWRRTWETYEELEKPDNYKLIFGTGRTPARRHEIGCEEALRWGASHILILGGDQVYPEKDMIRRMLKWMEVKDLKEWMARKKVINCLVPIRGHKPGQGTRPFQPIGMMIDPENNEEVPITRDSGDIVKAEIIGTGVMLFEADILRGMEKPWFGDEFTKGTNSVRVMQDVAFVQKLNNSGSQVWCDTQIIVKHLGVLEIDDTFQTRFA
jgi:hypothetical protein